MANEAVIIEYPKIIVRRTVAAGTAISKGTLCTLTDPNTSAASAAGTSAGAFGGVLMEDVSATDGSTNAPFAIKDGVFDIKVNSSNGVTLGAPVVLSGANLIRDAVAGDLLTGAVIGMAEETGSASEVIRVRLGH